MFTLAGVGYDAQRVFELEKKIAAGHWDVVKRRDADLSYNLVGFEELTEQNPGLDWAAWLSGLGADSEKFAEIVVRQPEFLHTFTALWRRSHWTIGRHGRRGRCFMPALLTCIRRWSTRPSLSTAPRSREPKRTVSAGSAG